MYLTNTLDKLVISCCVMGNVILVKAEQRQEVNPCQVNMGVVLHEAWESQENLFTFTFTVFGKCPSQK